MSAADQPGLEFELLAVTLMDIRATVESMRRSVDSAQSSVEQFRHKPRLERLLDIADCLKQMKKEAEIVLDSVGVAGEPLAALIGPPK